ncbi:MAG: hypothetical protein STSR0004_13790 [Peptococcaceae bacterium]
MKVINLTDQHEPIYFQCLEDWSDEIKEAGDHKEKWYEKIKDQGLRIKLAVDDNGVVGGMIQYLPVELSLAEGQDLYSINCIWVHGYKQGRGNFQRKGMGKALLQVTEEDVKSLGAKGIAAWGISLPFWMRASWFKKHGYRKVDRVGIQELLWKPFTEQAAPPKLVRQKKRPEAVPGKVVVTAFKNGWCPAQNLVYERAKRAAAEFGDKVVFHEVDTFDRKAFLEWGISDALFIDGRQIRTGPPPSYEKLKNTISKKAKKLK